PDGTKNVSKSAAVAARVARKRFIRGLQRSDQSQTISVLGLHLGQDQSRLPASTTSGCATRLMWIQAVGHTACSFPDSCPEVDRVWPPTDVALGHLFDGIQR